MKFRTEVELGGKTATGLRVPDEVVAGLGGGKRAAVVVAVGAYSYRTTIAVMGGPSYVPLSAEHRAAAGVSAGDMVDVTIELDTAPREVDVPADLAAAFADREDAAAFFQTLSYSNRKEWVRWIEEAKKPETRAARVVKTVEGLSAGKRTH